MCNVCAREQRQNALHALTIGLAREFDVIFIEDLNVGAMALMAASPCVSNVAPRTANIATQIAAPKARDRLIALRAAPARTCRLEQLPTSRPSHPSTPASITLRSLALQFRDM